MTSSRSSRSASQLKNGIVLFLQEDHELPFVSGSVLIPGGSRDEDPAKCGLIDLYGQTWRTSGTAKMDGDAMDDLLESKAAHIETGGDDDSTALSWDSLKADTDQVYDLAMDLLFHPKFDQQKLRLAQQQEATGIVRRNDDEGQIAGREAAKLVYGADSPYARQPELATIGEGHRGRSAGMARPHHRRQADHRASAATSIPPPWKPNCARPSNHCPRPSRIRRATTYFTGPKPGVYFINKEDVNQSQRRDRGRSASTGTIPMFPALAMMNDVFGGGFASRLFQKVRTAARPCLRSRRGLSALRWDHPGTFRRRGAARKSDSTVEATSRLLLK